MHDRKQELEHKFEQVHERLFIKDKRQMEQFYKKKLQQTLKDMQEASMLHKQSMNSTFMVTLLPPLKLYLTLCRVEERVGMTMT